MTTTTQPVTPVRSAWENDLRVIKNWVTFLGVVTLVGVIIGVICGIIIAVSIHSANVNNSNLGNISNCQTLGGTDPSC